jgi:hypothetical protein
VLWDIGLEIGQRRTIAECQQLAWTSPSRRASSSTGIARDRCTAHSPCVAATLGVPFFYEAKTSGNNSGTSSITTPYNLEPNVKKAR